MESLRFPVFIGILGLCWVYEGCMKGTFAYMEFGMLGMLGLCWVENYPT